MNPKGLHPLMAARKSGRAFDPERPVPASSLDALLEAARWAPSCSNNQPWRFVVCRGKGLDSAREALNPGNAWARRAPLIVALASKPEYDCILQGKEYFALGIGLAVGNLLLQAVAEGLMGHPIAGFSEEKLKSALGIPEDLRVHVLVVLGYEGGAGGLDEATRAKEAAPRLRRPLGETVYWEAWGRGPEGPAAAP